MIGKMKTAILLFIGLAGCLFSVLSWSPFRMSELAFGAFRPAGVVDGFRLIINRLFEVSEAEQAYRYVMLTINSPESDWGTNIAAALLILTLMIALLSFVLGVIHNKIAIFTTFITVIVFQIYFGVFPSAVWNVILFIAFAIMLSDKYGYKLKPTAWIRRYAVLMVIITITAAAVWVIHPNGNPELHGFSEAVRDRLGTRINLAATNPPEMQGMAGIEPTPREQALSVVEVGEEVLNESQRDEYNIERNERAQGAEVGAASPQPSLVPLLLVILAIMVLIGMIRYIPPFLRSAKRRRTFDTDEGRVAVIKMFDYMMEWLSIYGLKRKNVVFSKYAIWLTDLVSEQYSREYEDIAALWNKAVYSDHIIGEPERRYMKDFVIKTTEFVWENSRFVDKLKIKFYYFL